jgi:hypothetical protein
MRAVFHPSSRAVHDWTRALVTVENLLADDTVDLADVELLVNGDAVFLLAADSVAAGRVGDHLDRGVRVCACRNSLDTRAFAAENLLDGVELVPSGVGEPTRRQAEGYAYIKTR